MLYELLGVLKTRVECLIKMITQCHTSTSILTSSASLKTVHIVTRQLEPSSLELPFLKTIRTFSKTARPRTGKATSFDISLWERPSHKRHHLVVITSSLTYYTYCNENKRINQTSRICDKSARSEASFSVPADGNEA